MPPKKSLLRSRLNGTKGAVGFNYRLMDGEGADFSRQMADAFRASGWNVQHVVGNFLDEMTGMTTVAVADAATQPIAKAVCDALNEAGIRYGDGAILRPGSLGGPLAPGIVYVIVGRKE